MYSAFAVYPPVCFAVHFEQQPPASATVDLLKPFRTDCKEYNLSIADSASTSRPALQPVTVACPARPRLAACSMQSQQLWLPSVVAWRSVVARNIAEPSAFVATAVAVLTVVAAVAVVARTVAAVVATAVAISTAIAIRTLVTIVQQV